MEPLVLVSVGLSIASVATVIGGWVYAVRLFLERERDIALFMAVGMLAATPMLIGVNIGLWGSVQS